MNRFVSWEIASKANKWQGRNVTRWRNDEYDRLYRAADEEMDPAKRGAMFIRMNDLVIQNVVTIPVLWRNGVSASTHATPRDGSVGLGVDILAPAVLVSRRLVAGSATARAPAAPEPILRAAMSAVLVLAHLGRGRGSPRQSDHHDRSAMITWRQLPARCPADLAPLVLDHPDDQADATQGATTCTLVVEALQLFVSVVSTTAFRSSAQASR